MKLKIFGAIIIILVLFWSFGGGFSSSESSRATPKPTTRPTKAWYDGGTLHQKTVADWMAATDANRLATAGDWTAVFTEFDDLDEARSLAEDLVECVDGSVDAAPETMKASDLAASCAVLMCWEPKE